MAKVSRTTEELEFMLVEQLRLLRKSCGNDEQWDFTEGHNVVARLRVLLHETPQSHSLLGQLNIRSGKFLHSVGPGSTLVIPASYGPWPRFLIPYSPWSESDCIDFEDWWLNTEIKVSKYASSRKELITMLANQEGGAHVDPNMKAGLADLKRNGAGWSYISEDGSNPLMHGFEVGTIRAIGFELLWSLEKTYGNYLASLREKYGDEVEDQTYMRSYPDQW